MKTITEQSRQISVTLDTDVLVVGGGPAGISAAVAAAREGMRVAIVERTGCFGGNITQAMVESISWYRHEKTVEAGGILFEMETKAKEIGAVKKDPQSTGVLLDTELFKCVADGMIKDARVTPLLHCYAVDAVMDGNTVGGVITESKSGRTAILAKRTIDASGDADIAFYAKAECQHAPVPELMEVTSNFACADVDIKRFTSFLAQQHGKVADWAKETGGKENDLPLYWFNEAFNKAKDAGEVSPEAYLESWWPGGHTDSGDVTNLNAVHMRGIDPTNVLDITKAEIEGRRLVMLALAALRKYMPGFEKARLRNFGMSLGTRDSRKIVGVYCITGHNVRNEARFEDSIGVCPEFLDAFGIIVLPTTGRYFQIPYASILPKTVENIVVAGRCVAGDRVSHAATRNIVCCTATGQAAGVAAAISIAENAPFRRVNVPHLQRALEKQGVRVK